MDSSPIKHKALHFLTAEKLTEHINAWAGWATENKQNIALYRTPGHPPYMLLDGNPLTEVCQPIEELNQGFIFANYEGKAWHLEAAQTIEFTNSEQPPLPLTENHKHGSWKYYTQNGMQETTSKKAYTQWVAQAVDAINEGQLTKLVPTKLKLHTLGQNFDLAKTFVTLCHTYPNAFVSVVSTKEFGTWLTATPEVLIKVSSTGIFETMALAGTQKHTEEKPLHQVAWVDKDIEEQAMVSRYIINRFKEIRLREFIEKGPQTVKAGNLTHLCTTFTVDTKATNFHNLGGVMLNLLHPTSAVCGMPKEAAVALIHSLETHDRKFYTGYLGPVNLANETALYVNLRCMELFQHQANLFAGAGVTAFSEPEKEWEETELKFNTLLTILS